MKAMRFATNRCSLFFNSCAVVEHA